MQRLTGFGTDECDRSPIVIGCVVANTIGRGRRPTSAADAADAARRRRTLADRVHVPARVLDSPEVVSTVPRLPADTPCTTDILTI